MVSFIKKYKINISIFLILYILAIYIISTPFQTKKFEITFFDIGQGDSIYITTPYKHTILVDGGPNNSLERKLASKQGFFSRHLDLVVITHPHADHMDGFISVFNKYDIDNLMITTTMFGDKNYDKLLKVANEKNINIILANAKTDFKIGDLLIDTIYPLNFEDVHELKNVNNTSIVLKISYLDHSILLTGDLEKEGEKIILQSGTNINADILKVGHHGSKTSSTPAFLNAITPTTAIIQSGASNSFGHPHKETLDNLENANVFNILRNDQIGDISFEF